MQPPEKHVVINTASSLNIEFRKYYWNTYTYTVK